MKTLDRILFGIIAASLLLLAVKSFMPEPVRANPGEIIDVKIVGVKGYWDLPVAIRSISSYVVMPVKIEK